MLVTHDIFTLTVLFIVLLCVCLKGSGKKSTRDSGRSVEEIFRDINEQNRYQKWLLEHRQE